MLDNFYDFNYTSVSCLIDDDEAGLTRSSEIHVRHRVRSLSQKLYASSRVSSWNTEVDN